MPPFTAGPGFDPYCKSAHVPQSASATAPNKLRRDQEAKA